MNVMEIIKQDKDLGFLHNHGKHEPLTQVAQRLKEQLSHIPFYANNAQGGNDYWNSLASSHFNS
jgi:hypothetical protein